MGSVRGLQDGEGSSGGDEGLGTRGPGPHSPRSSMAGRGRIAWGEQSRAGAVSGGGGGRGTSGSWRPGRDHVRKPGPAGMGLEGGGGGGSKERENPGWGRVRREGHGPACLPAAEAATPQPWLQLQGAPGSPSQPEKWLFQTKPRILCPVRLLDTD